MGVRLESSLVVPGEVGGVIVAGGEAFEEAALLPSSSCQEAFDERRKQQRVREEDKGNGYGADMPPHDGQEWLEPKAPE